MNKKLMAAAVAGALGVAVPGLALAQSSTVQIGGGVHLIYGHARTGNGAGAGASSKHDNMLQSEPEIFVKGEEKLGGGLTAWFQCTSSFDVIGTAAQSTTGAGQWCGRNSGMGFRGSFGNVFAGTWDTPHKLNYNQARGWFSGTNVFGGTGTLLYSGAQSNAGNTGASFYRRQSRAFNYHSPSWGGFTVQGAVSASNEQASIAEAPGRDPRLYSVSGAYRGGPLYVGLSWERHQDFRAVPAAAPGGDDDGLSLVGVFTLANNLRLSGVIARNEYENIAVAGDNLKQTGAAVYLDWKLAGPHSLKAQFGKAKDGKGTVGAAIGNFKVGANTGGKVHGIAYAYDFSKRTQGYIGYAEMKNDSATAEFDQGIADASLGGKQRFVGFGLRHRF